MPQNISDQKFEEALDRLDGRLLEVATSEDTGKKIDLIGRRNGVEQKTPHIAALIGDIFLGLLPIKNFIPALQADAGLDPQTAKRVAYDVRAQIFAYAAQELAKLQHNANLESEAREINIEQNPASGEAGQNTPQRDISELDKKTTASAEATRATPKLAERRVSVPRGDESIPSQNIVDLSNKLR